jgi:TolB-like protein
MLKSDLSLGGVVEFSIRKAESRSRVNIQLTKRF